MYNAHDLKCEPKFKIHSNYIWIPNDMFCPTEKCRLSSADSLLAYALFYIDKLYAEKLARLAYRISV